MAGSDPKMLAEINAILIAREELWELAADSEEYHRENPDGDACFEAGIAMIASRVKKGDFRKVHAIWCRMNALAKLVVAGEAPGWTRPTLTSHDEAGMHLEILLVSLGAPQLETTTTRAV